MTSVAQIVRGLLNNVVTFEAGCTWKQFRIVGDSSNAQWDWMYVYGSVLRYLRVLCLLTTQKYSFDTGITVKSGLLHVVRPKMWIETMICVKVFVYRPKHAQDMRLTNMSQSVDKINMIWKWNTIWKKIWQRIDATTDCGQIFSYIYWSKLHTLGVELQRHKRPLHVLMQRLNAQFHLHWRYELPTWAAMCANGLTWRQQWQSLLIIVICFSTVE